jgi:hypothetical protein
MRIHFLVVQDGEGFVLVMEPVENSRFLLLMEKWQEMPGNGDCFIAQAVQKSLLSVV